MRKCSSRPLYPIINYVPYDSIRPGYCDFIYALLSVLVPKNTQEALMSREWKTVMDEEMVALERNSTWELEKLPPGSVLWGVVRSTHPNSILMVVLRDKRPG